MKVERIRDLENLEKRRDIWNELLFSSEQNCIFLTHEWISSWWKCFSGESSLESLNRRNPFPSAEASPGTSCWHRSHHIVFIPSAAEASDYIDSTDSSGKTARLREDGGYREEGHHRGAEGTEEEGVMSRLVGAVRAAYWSLIANLQSLIPKAVFGRDRAPPTAISGLRPRTTRRGANGPPVEGRRP